MSSPSPTEDLSLSPHPVVRSRTASDSESDLMHFQFHHHPAYSARRGSCPAVPTASALSLSLLRDERTPKRYQEIWKAFERLTATDQKEDADKIDSNDNDDVVSSQRRRPATSTDKEHNQIEDSNLINKQVITVRANRYHIEEDMKIDWLDQENFCVEFPSIVADDDDDLDNDDLSIDLMQENKTGDDKSDRSHHGQQSFFRKFTNKVRFSRSPLKVFSTYSCDEYDRRNSSVDPLTAFSVFELERRLEKMELLDIEIRKESDGRLGFDIIGMGMNADRGNDQLSIFIKSITPNGVADKDGRLGVWDQIVEVDGESLVGVSQHYAAYVLRNTQGVVKLKIARDKDAENSEIANLCKNNNQSQN